MDTRRPHTPDEALQVLLDGNRRFLDGNRLHPNQDADHRAALAASQRPFAVLFGCSDSRLAAEIIFDRGLGDLFVVRTAGHVIGAEVLGSIEYGVCELGAQLVVVLGHDRCGAVTAAYETMSTGVAPGGHLRRVIERVMPSLRLAHAAGLAGDLDSCSEVHIRHTADQIVDRSPVLAAAVAEGRCAVVAMSYRLAEGGLRVLTGTATSAATAASPVPTSPAAPSPAASTAASTAA